MTDAQPLRTPLVLQTAEFVRDQLQANDASHDWRHIERVWELARRIAHAEAITAERIEIVDLAALLHDIDDWKYQQDNGNPTRRAEAFLRSCNVPESKVADVMQIIDRMGFKEELGEDQNETTPEFGCVQDADRLDAIGAIGIARCFTYGGNKKRPLYDPDLPCNSEITKEQYMDKTRASPTINHFYEKLLKLKGMMKTRTGARLAEERHAFMEQFLTQFHEEVAGNR